MKKLILGHIGEEDVRPSIVVVVSDGDSHAVALALHARLLRDIGEGAVAVVVEQPIPIFGRFLSQRRDGRAVDEINVQIAVVIVIEQGHAGQHRFGQVLVRRWATVGCEAQAGTVRDFFECDGAQRGGGYSQKRRTKEQHGPSHHL